MSVVEAKCTNCGEVIEVDNNKEAAICPFCKEAFIVEKAIRSYFGNTNRNLMDFEIVGGVLNKYVGSLTEIEIPSNVTVIGVKAFANTAITYVHIPSNVIEIRSGAFYKCNYLREVIIEEGLQMLGSEKECNHDYPYNGSVFNECSKLEYINLPDSLIDLGKNCFCGCKSLKTITIPPNVKYSSDFVGCESLRQIQLPYGLEKLGSFEGCINLKSINIPSTVKDVGHTSFTNCKSLKKLKIPEGITPIMPQCYGCENLENVIIPSTIKCINELTFGNCEKLDNVVIPSNVTIQGDGLFGESDNHFRSAFEGCTGMHMITLGQNVRFRGLVFLSCENLENIYGLSEQWLKEHSYELPENMKAKYSKGCYIATCVYGSYNCPQVFTLRRFRDLKLEKNIFGRILVKFYYKISPSLVKKYGNTKRFRQVCKFLLDFLVQHLKKIGYKDTIYYDEM